MASKSDKPTYHQEVSERLIGLLEQGKAPWQQPWDAARGSQLPFNASTGNTYRGINAINLMCRGYSDPRWLTYKQAQDMGAQVNKGERSASIQYWKFPDKNAGKGGEGEDESIETSKFKGSGPRVFFASVFNAEQISGLPPLEDSRKKHEWEGIDRAEKILSSSQATIRHVTGNRAFYNPGDDRITLPTRDQFPNPSAYYATALHELGHWTGHESRLDRSIMNRFGSPDYAKEELRAEISSMMLCEELGLQRDPSTHAEYVRSWIQVLKDDHTEIFRAAAEAEKIKAYVLSLEQAKDQSASAIATPVQMDTESQRFGLNRVRSYESQPGNGPVPLKPAMPVAARTQEDDIATVKR